MLSIDWLKQQTTNASYFLEDSIYNLNIQWRSSGDDDHLSIEKQALNQGRKQILFDHTIKIIK